MLGLASGGMRGLKQKGCRHMTKQETLWHDRAAALRLPSAAFVAGRKLTPRSEEIFDVVNPATGASLGAIPILGEQDVNLAVAAARAAFESGVWSQRAPGERKAVLLRLAALLEDHAEELALLESLNTGKPISDALAVDIPSAVSAIAWYGEAVDKIYDDVAPTANDVMAFITREPIGVVAAVVPWNFPLLMACWKVAPALAAGNSVLLKPAELTPLTAIRLAELAQEAGIPDGVFNVVTGTGPVTGRALGLHMDVDAITFTGSTAIGKQFMAYASQSNLKRVALECGGKSPNIVLADCRDLDEAAMAAAFGIFFNQGEVCCAGSRLLVQDSIKDVFLEKLIAQAAQFVAGDPLDPETRLGALISQPHMAKVQGLIALAHDEGAQLLCGGHQVRAESGGYFLEPTVFDGVSQDMSIGREEVFGPVLSVMTFDTPDEAVRIANNSIYGLGAGVWTSNIDTALTMSKRIKAGTVWINNYDESDITVPFGGYKQSGIGRDKSLQALSFFQETKTTWIRLRG